MNEALKFFDDFSEYMQNGSILADIINSFLTADRAVNWLMVMKICMILVISLLIAGGLLIVNDTLYDRFIRRRVKTHHLTISNNGNTNSIYLLRTVDLSKSLAIRFRVNGEPMILVTYQKEKANEGDQGEENAAAAAPDEKREDETENANLIPDLKNPMGNEKKVQPKEAAKTVTKTAGKIGKKAGFFASMISNILSLLPWTSKELESAQGSLKDLQQSTNQLTSTINTKVSTAENLTKQLGQLPMADKLSAAAQSSGLDPASIGQTAADQIGFVKGQSADSEMRIGKDEEMLQTRFFSYDNEAWLENIGKVDEKGGSLNFFQSKVLAPGEAMKIDVEIMNLADSPIAVSHLYKIEIQQIPQSSLHLTVPPRYVNGIVIFKKVSQAARILPQTIMVGLIFLSIQLIASLSYLFF